jgi:hypothetical protein
MPIISVTPGQVGLVGVLPSIAYIQTTDPVATVVATGYLNKEVASGIQFSLPCIAAVATKETPTSVTQVGWYEVQHVGSDWSLQAGSNSGLALTNGHIFVGDASNIATDVAMTGDITITNAGVTAIGAGVIVNADINAAAAIAYSKLAALPSAQILVGSAGNVATAVAMTGDVTITNAGVTAIGAGIIVNADINAAAAIDFSKLAALTSGNILVGSAGNVAASVAMSGDITISNAGVTAIGAGKVLLAMLGTGITPAAVIKFMNEVTTVGGAAAEAFTVTGAVGATDRAFVQLVAPGSNTVSVLYAVVTDNTLTVTFSGNPGNDAIINYQIVREAS